MPSISWRGEPTVFISESKAKLDDFKLAGVLAEHRIVRSGILVDISREFGVQRDERVPLLD